MERQEIKMENIQTIRSLPEGHAPPLFNGSYSLLHTKPLFSEH